MSNFKNNVLVCLESNEVLRLPKVPKDCNVVHYDVNNGRYMLSFYKLENNALWYFAFGRWNTLPDLEYSFKRTNFYYCEQI